MHVAVIDRSVATSIAATIVSETVTLPNINCFLACLRPHVEVVVRSYAVENKKRTFLAKNGAVSRPGTHRLRRVMNSSEKIAVDPVCKMELCRDQIRESLTVGGERYYFCSIGCRAEFQRHPTDYIGRTAKESHHV